MIIIRTNLEKLPTTCCNCPIKAYDPQIVWKDALMTQWGGWVCPISGQLIDNTKREEFCPLEEIPQPPHGRTIDADALYAVMKKERDRIAKDYGDDDPFARCLTKYAMSMVLSAPTIIEAEGEA